MAYIDTKRYGLVIAVMSIIALLLVAPVAALTWDITTVDSTADVGKYSSLTLDKYGIPWISYYDATNGNLKYAFLNAGGWNIDTADNSASDVGQYSSLRIRSGPLDTITISYYDKTNGVLKLAYNSGSGWNTATVDTVGDVGKGTSIAVGSSPNPPRISYYDTTSSTLKYANYSYSSGTASLATLGSSAGGGGGGGAFTSLAPDSSGNPRISYFGAAGGLQYASCDGVCSNPADWSTTTVDSNGLAGVFSSLALDSTGNPRIGYYDGTAGDLKYASCNGACNLPASWTITTLDSAGIVGLSPSLALDSAGNPRISYQDYTKGSLKYASCSGACTLPASWTITTVDSTGVEGGYTSHVLDSTGSSRISYYDNTTHVLKYARGWNTPVSNFTASPTSGPAPLTVTFTDTSTNTSTSWNWNFGSWSAADGGISTLRNPSHIFTRAGNYTVSLDVRNPDGGVPLNRVAYINVTDASAPEVVSNFTALTTSGTAPLTVNFLDNSTNTPTSWNWNFGSWSAGDGGVSVLPNPSHTFASAGTYTVSLNAQNANGGNTFIRTAYITVTAPGGGGGGGGSGSGSVPGSGTGTSSISTSDSDYPR
ncbi:MAG: PKD domain-containing protein [Methanoregula sp.]|nr:PKD domain-containing protein [Methanoregula sp.]